MKTAGTVAFFAILAASLATNVVLLVRPELLLPQREAPREKKDIGAPATRPFLLLPPPFAQSTPTGTLAANCRNRLNDLAAKRAELKRRLEGLATPKQSFDESPSTARNLSLAAELRKHLRLEGRDDWVPSNLECRGLVCRVANDHDASTAPMLDRVWSRRNLLGTDIMRTATYFRIRDENVPAGIDVVERFAEDFRRSGAVDRCTARFHDEGKLEVQLSLGTEDNSLDDAPLGLSLRTTGGLLVNTPLGTCIIEALHDAFGRTSLPPMYTGAMGFRIVFP